MSVCQFNSGLQMTYVSTPPQKLHAYVDPINDHFVVGDLKGKATHRQ